MNQMFQITIFTFEYDIYCKNNLLTISKIMTKYDFQIHIFLFKYKITINVCQNAVKFYTILPGTDHFGRL